MADISGSTGTIDNFERVDLSISGTTAAIDSLEGVYPGENSTTTSSEKNRAVPVLYRNIP
jgi:hypothetical protein